MRPTCDASPEIRCAAAPIAYRAALAEMAQRNALIREGAAAELIWCLEHPSVYTAGTSAQPAELREPRFEVVTAGRGGRYTYHGPGQRVTYVLVDLARRGPDVRRFIFALEGWIIATLGAFGITAWRSDAGVGIWTRDPAGDGAQEAKIAAIGVRIRRWVTMHGAAVNLSPDLSHYGGIVPCGIAEKGVTSLAACGITVSAAEWDAALLARLPDFLSTLEAASGRGQPAMDDKPIRKPWA